MRTPATARKCAYKAFFVFFGFGSKYSGCYAVIHARSLEKANMKAIEEFGAEMVRGVYGNEEQAKAKIRAFRLVPIGERA